MHNRGEERMLLSNMELKLEVVLSSSIKRKKPWPRFCWLGQEKESVFLLDDKRISEINMVSGRTKKKTPKLHPLLNSVVTMASSHNGMWLCGLLGSGELFLWNRDKDLLKTAAAVPEVVNLISAIQGNATRLSIKVSGDGLRALLVTTTGQVFLWECINLRDLTGVRDGSIKGRWAHIQSLQDTLLPSLQDKEASKHTIFVKTEAMGDACLSAFVFTSGKKLIITCLKIQWEEGHVRVGSVGYSIHWATKTYSMSRLTPSCQPVKSRGAMIPAFSPDGRLLAIVLNQRQPKATQVLFVSTQNFVSISSGLGGCGSIKKDIPSKYIRSYWVGSVSWSPDGLFLACVLKRGSLLMLARLGGLLTLTSSGCNIDFGPAHFLPLHPLVTYRPPLSAGKADASLSSSSMSVRDVMRQRYSVTWHPRLLYFIVSDGYMATVLRVLGRPSPALLLKTLLKDTTKDLEKASLILNKSKIHVRTCWESVSYVNLDSSFEEFKSGVTCAPNTTDPVTPAATEESTLPLFLQDQGTFGGTKELLEKFQTFFEGDSDVDGPPAGSHTEDGGRLEFASMFDTVHALDTHTDTRLAPSPDHETERNAHHLHRELGKIQSRLLTAWSLSLSLGNTVENRTDLLKYTLHCVVRFAALLHLISSPNVHTGKKNPSVSTRLLHLLKAVLAFLPWDSTHSDGPACLGLVIKLSKRLVRLLLTIEPGLLSSDSLSSAVLILQTVSDSLDHTYSLQQRTVWSSAEKEPLSESLQCWPSDVYYVPLLQDGKDEESGIACHGLPVPQRPSSRLFGVWQYIYEITQRYMEELKGFEGYDGWEEEHQRLSVIMSQIQTALQATGQRLEEGPTLLSYPGEHLFLSGLYSNSADTWRSQIWEESKKSCHRSVFQETRLCLALLYSLLSQYQLRQAQQLGDHMAHLMLHRAGHQTDNTTCTTADSLPDLWLPMDLHSDAACAVIQTLGRFMASYFTNQPLYILPPHNVAILPPIHLPDAPSVGRLVPLCQEEVARAVRQQQVSEAWTVDYAQDLLMLGGLLPESVWLAYHLGDWKTAASLSLAYNRYCTDHFDFTRFKRRELHLQVDLEPQSIFQTELDRLLGNKADVQERRDNDGDKSLTDPLEGEDLDLLQVSIQEILKASVMAGVNVLSSPLSSLLNTVKDLCSCLSALVHNGLYLPAPPLYCPQPSPNTQDPEGPLGQFAEFASRQKVSGVLQRLLLLLRSAHCCHPAAQWYISHLRRARHILHKIKKKYSYPSAAEEEKAFPEGLMKFVTRGGFFRGPNKDLDPETIQTIICFRELCGLCWMLHVRDQLSLSCRKYQASRQRGRDAQISGDSGGNSACVDALQWARRYLPFSHFLNAEEILQDILLSLVSELPPVTLVADTLAHAFPREEESVRVPLREKYNSLLQRLRQCKVLEGENEEASELMMILIQDKLRQRRKHLGRLKRHLGPPELHLWEKEEEEEDRGSKHGMAILRQLSLGTSLSTSTLTDYGFPPLCCDGDTMDNKSEAISPDQHSRTKPRSKKVKIQDKESAKRTAVKIKGVIKEESHPGDTEENESQHNVGLPSLPVVSTWEFELEDEEYLNFLELFLSYVLEKDSTDGGDSVSEPPLLTAFCSKLRERELHSLTFDVLTTLHRRQTDGQHPSRKHGCSDPPVFRAGCCYKPMKRGTTPEPGMGGSVSRTNLSNPLLPRLRTERQTGLFGLRQQSSVPLDQILNGRHAGSDTNPNQSAFLFGSSVEAVIELQQFLDPKLEAQFPELGRLLEWMLRWADRRVLLGHHGKKKKLKGEGLGGTADEGVMIRVKASAPAVLTSLSLLERRYSALLGACSYSPHIQVPEPQWTVAPVLQPELDKKLERESSVDTGYPGSVNTPITGPDQNIQDEQSICSHTGEAEEQILHRTSLPNDQEDLISDAQRSPSRSPQPSFDDLEVQPEKDGISSDSEGLEVLSSISDGNISVKVCTPGTSLQLADLDVSVKDMTSSTSLHAGSLQAPPHPEPPGLPTVLPEELIHAELSDSTAALFPNTAVEPQRPQPQCSTAGAPTVAPICPNTPTPTQTPPMRQRLGEDLFKLVQNINYMSLMEVLGASFSNLQLAQQNSSLAQSSLNNLIPNVPSSNNFMPQQSALPHQSAMSMASQTHTCLPSSESGNPQVSQAPTCMEACQLPIQSTANPSSTGGQYQNIRNLPCNVQAAGGNAQEFQPLSVQTESPETQCREHRRLIPFSQGLLTTTNTSHAIPSAPIAVHSKGDTQTNPPAHYPPAQGPRVRLTENPATLESHQPEFKDRDRPASKRKLSFNTNPPDPTLTRSHPQNQTWERSQQPEVSILPPTLPDHRVAPTQYLRLLHPQPDQHNIITFPKIPLPSPRSFTLSGTPMPETPMMKLLHIDAEPKTSLPSAAPSAQMTHLMSMEELTGLVVGRHIPEEARLQFLRVDPTIENRRRATTSPRADSSKRQKRREKARTASVTFKPNESIIPTQEPEEEPINDEPAVSQEIPTREDVAFQPGSVDTLLTGQRLLDKAVSTAAELHAFASTCKRPPECHDAFTNTDPACSPIFVNKSAQASVTESSPHAGNTQSYREVPVQDTVETAPSPEKKNVDQLGHHFLTVLDLEDGTQHQDLPYVSPGTRIAPSISPPPSSAQLHVLATSVIRSSHPAADPQPPVTIQEDTLMPITQPDIIEESPSHSYIESNREQERIPPQEPADPSDSVLFEAIRTKNIGLHSAVSAPSTVWFSSHLSELDAQLAALQKIADHLEKDFTTSRMLVNTIETLAPAFAPDVRTVKKHVRLTVPEEAWMPQSNTATVPNDWEEDEENLEEEYMVHDDSCTAERKTFHHSTSSPSHSAGPSHHLPPPQMKQMTGASRMSPIWAEDNLGQTGLSDTAELLDGLVKEGYISLTDLDSSSSPTPAHNSSRLEQQQQSTWMSEKRVLPEDERRELRIWMRQKQRESLAVYQKHRETLREREHKPFPIPRTLKSTYTKPAIVRETREKKEKLMLLEQYNRRTQEASYLVSDFHASPLTRRHSPVTGGAPMPFTTRHTSAAPSGNIHRRSLKSQSRQQEPHLYPLTAEAQGGPSEDGRRRLGLHRPVTSLPKDRMCQITRRGMVTYTKSHTDLHTDSQDGERHVRYQRKSAWNKSPSVGRGIQRQRTSMADKEEIDAVNVVWPSRGMLKQPGPEESDPDAVLAGLLDELDDDVRASVSVTDCLDNLSESDSCCLSKIDWAAIERMTAEEED